MDTWDTRDMGEAQHFLGLTICRDRTKRTIHLSQTELLKSCLKDYDLLDCNLAETPFDSNYTFCAQESQDDQLLDEDQQQRFQSSIGRVFPET